MNIKYFFIFLTIFLSAISPHEAFACFPIGNASISGPSYCEDGFDAQVPARYEANYSSSCSGCDSHIWELTGGMFVDASNLPRFFDGQNNPLSNGEIKITECECKVEDWIEYDACISVFGSLNALDNNVVHVRWDPNAPLQQLKLKGTASSGSLGCDDDDKILYKRVSSPTGIRINRNECTTANLTALIESNDCRDPDSYRWFRNGTFIGSSTSPTRNVNISTDQSTNISVTTTYGNSESNRASRSIPPGIIWPPNGISGPTILPPGPLGFITATYQVLGTNGTVIQWSASTSDVGFNTTSGNTTDLFISNYVLGQVFTIEAQVERCGEIRSYFLTVVMDDCDPGDPGCVPFKFTDSTDDQLTGNTASYLTITEGYQPRNNEEAFNNRPLNSFRSPIVENPYILAYPNPVDIGQELILKNLPEQHFISVLNGHGKLVITIENSGSQDRIPTQSLIPGQYFILISDQNDSSILESIRILVQ